VFQRSQPPGAPRFPYTTLFRSVLGRQVADVTVGGEDAIIAAQIFLDGLGLGRGFDDDKLHERSLHAYAYTQMRVWGGPSSPSLRSEEHTAELQSRENLVCRLPL